MGRRPGVELSAGPHVEHSGVAEPDPFLGLGHVGAQIAPDSPYKVTKMSQNVTRRAWSVSEARRRGAKRPP